MKKPIKKIKEINIKDYPQLATPEETAVIKDFYDANPKLKSDKKGVDASKSEAEIKNIGIEVDDYNYDDYNYDDDNDGHYTYNSKDPWIQTYSGRRFTPTNPNPDAIVIQDIAHALSMLCRFTGHCQGFYSVAQHSVLVSYICNQEHALFGLLHDGSEAYIADLSRPLKHSGQFETYIQFENVLQKAICKRFGLPEIEPASVKLADAILLATEARDLMSPQRSDWVSPVEPLPFKIEPLPPREAKDLFMKRYFELTDNPNGYENYLHFENMKI